MYEMQLIENVYRTVLFKQESNANQRKAVQMSLRLISSYTYVPSTMCKVFLCVS